MKEPKVCAGCGKRMSVEDEKTGTHPLQECYQRRIQKLTEQRETLLGWLKQWIERGR